MLESTTTDKGAVLLVVLALLSVAGIFTVSRAEGDVPLPVLDAYVKGTVHNGSSGMHVEISSLFDLTPSVPDDPQNNKQRYFNGTTDSSGSFTITVDSNATGNEYLILMKYSVVVRPTYYLGMNKWNFMLPHYIGSGETYTIPQGELEAFPEDLANLTVRIMNSSGGTPVQNAAVTIKHISHPIPPPFELSKLTDANGEATWYDIRTVNTSVEAKRLHFQDLSKTEPRNYITAQKDTNTVAIFDLVEDPWPFSTVPRDGATDVNVSNGLMVDFGQVMDRSSITDPSNYRLSTDGITPVTISLSPAPDDRSVSILSFQPLSYDTDHVLRLDTTLRTSGGGKPLWRAMEVRFRTELPPGTVSGRLVDSVKGEGAWGTRVQISDQRVTVNSTGHFHFPVVPKGTYRLDVLDSYLYNETYVPGINVAKGSSVQLGDILIDPKPRGSLEVTVESEAGPVQGATVKVLSTLLSEDELNLTTGADGKAFFPMVRAGNVNLKGSAPRHSTRIDVSIVKADRENSYTLRLTEDPLPVTVTATKPLGGGVVDPDTDLVIKVPEEIKFQTLDVKLWTLDRAGQHDTLMELAAPTKGSEPLTYVVNIPGKLPKETGFELVIDDGLQALDDLSFILWRDVNYRFRTPDHPLSYVVGTLLLEGSPYKDLGLVLGPFSGATGTEGAFNITVDLSKPSETHVLRTNISGMGYNDLNMELVITPGRVFDLGALVVYPLPGWYSVSPADGGTGVEPSTNVTFFFAEPVTDGGDGWSKLLKVIPQGSSAPVLGVFFASSDNRTVTFDPATDLTEGQTYIVEASSKLMLSSGGPALPVGNMTSFTVRPRSLVVTLKEPDTAVLTSFPLDGIIKLSFNARVNTTLIASSLSISPVPTGLRYEWPSSSELWIFGLYRIEQSFELVIPVGQYGIGGEPLRNSFSISYAIEGSYSQNHAPESFQMLPETNWVKGSLVRVSGSSPGSIGYEVSVVVKKGGSEVTYRTIVSSDGSFNLSFNAPDITGDHQVIIRVGIPGGPSAYERTYAVSVKDEQGQNGGDGLDPLFIVIAVVLVLLILAILIGGFLYIKAQRRKLSERPDIEYSDVDADWSDEE